MREGLRPFARLREFSFATGNEVLTCLGCCRESGEEADVVDDVGERVWSEGEDGEAGFQDRREGFHAVGNGSDHQVGPAGGDFGGVGRPGVVEDGKTEAGELGHGFDAVFGEAAERVEAAKGGDRQSDGGLEGDDTHGLMVAGCGLWGTKPGGPILCRFPWQRDGGIAERPSPGFRMTIWLVEENSPSTTLQDLLPQTIPHPSGKCARERMGHPDW